MVSSRIQKVCYRFIASVFLNGQPVHLSDDRGLDWVFLPADFLAVVYPSEPERCTRRVYTFFYSSTHIGTHPFRCSSAFGTRDPGFDQQDKFFIYIFVCRHDRDTGILQFPVTLQYLSRVPAEAIKVLDDDDIGISLNRIFDHAPVFLPVIAAPRYDIHKMAQW